MHDDDLATTRQRHHDAPSEYVYHSPYTPSALFRRFTSGEWRRHDRAQQHHHAPPPPQRVIIEDNRDSSIVMVILAAFFGTLMALMIALVLWFIVTHVTGH